MGVWTNFCAQVAKNSLQEHFAADPIDRAQFPESRTVLAFQEIGRDLV